MKKFLFPLVLLLVNTVKADNYSLVSNFTALKAVVNIKTTSGDIAGWSIINTNASVCYVQFFNALAANVTIGTTKEIMDIGLSSSGTSYMTPPAVNFSTALSAGTSTAAGGGTACTTGLVAVFWYR